MILKIVNPFTFETSTTNQARLEQWKIWKGRKFFKFLRFSKLQWPIEDLNDKGQNLCYKRLKLKSYSKYN